MAEFRAWSNEKRTPLYEVIPLDTPYNIQIETSSLCNLKCIYCAHSSKKHGLYEGNMTIELFEHILRDVADFPHKVKVFEMFSFGEPLCNPLLPKMIAMARNSGLCENINFTTNGLLFTPKLVENIIAAGTNTIRISLQGINADAYRKFCGVSIDFQKFKSNLRYLYEHRDKCIVRMKIADLALKGIENSEEQLQNLFGDMADSIYIEKIVPMFKGIEYDDIDISIRKNSINGRENISQRRINKVCHRPFYRLRVSSDGKVTAACCDKPHDIYYGDINRESLINLWNGARRSSFLKTQLRGERFSIPACADCVMPNDIKSELDILDPWADDILYRLK